MSIDNADITVVVQGPVQALPDRDMDEGITAQCLNSVRRYLPGAKIILSTWAAQQLEGLDYDELVISDDPGSNIDMYKPDGSPNRENTNRQIVSTVAGLKRVTTPYAMKLRTDNFLIGDQFKQLQQTFTRRHDEYRFLKQRVVTNNTFTRMYAKGMRVNFHACDFFYFGLTEDVLALWDLPHLPDYPLDKARLGKEQHASSPYFILDVTQKLWLAALQRFDPSIQLQHLNDSSPELTRTSDLCYANNLVVGEPEVIGLGLCSKFSGNKRANSLASRISYLTHHEWLRLYKRYCDPELQIANNLTKMLKLRLLRLIHLPGKWLEGRLRLAKYVAKNR